MEQKRKEVKIQIKGSDAVLGGTYANNLMVHMTREEFTLDFINIVPPSAILNARVVVSPAHLKRMLKTLKGSLEKFEQEFGKLPEPPPSTPGELVQ
jgi:hypothetical protein